MKAGDHVSDDTRSQAPTQDHRLYPPRCLNMASCSTEVRWYTCTALSPTGTRSYALLRSCNGFLRPGRTETDPAVMTLIQSTPVVLEELWSRRATI